jgi:hypothetical protein
MQVATAISSSRSCGYRWLQTGQMLADGAGADGAGANGAG